MGVVAAARQKPGLPQDRDPGNYYSMADLFLEAAIIGVADAKTGETMKAFAVPKDDFAHGELKKYCQFELAAYKVLHEFSLRSQLPKSNVGKFLVRELCEPGSPES